MRKITYRAVYNRKKHLNASSKALLQVEAYLEGRKIYFSTHIYLTPNQWDKNRQLIKEHPLANELNMMVREFILKLELKELELWKNGYEICLELLKEKCTTLSSSSFVAYIQEFVNASNIKETTRKNRLTTCSLIAMFRPHATFKDVNSRFVFEFERFLYNKNLQMNTVAKHMKHLRLFVNSSIDNGYLNAEDYAFKRYRIKTKEFKHAFLTSEEVNKLEQMNLINRQISLQHTLDAFLFCCYTGLRYSDFTSLTEDNIVEIDKKKWIVFRSVKTDVEVKLPLNLLFEGKPLILLKKHIRHLNKFFTLKSNSAVNKELIRIGKLAKIEKHFSFHSARHTNATLLMEKGANITTVQKLLGHRSISTTQIYSQILESTLVNDLKKCSQAKCK